MKILLTLLMLFAFAPVYAAGTALEIEADNSLEWDRPAKTFMAKGNAVAKNGDIFVHADLLVAYYEENESGDIIIKKIVATGSPYSKQNDGTTIHAKTLTAFVGANNKLDHLEAKNNVKIKSASQEAEGDLAIYKYKTKVATLTGNVVLSRGSNLLFGDKAEFNLKTDVARLSSNEGTGRVRGVFYVDEKQSKE